MLEKQDKALEIEKALAKMANYVNKKKWNNTIDMQTKVSFKNE